MLTQTLKADVEAILWEFHNMHDTFHGETETHWRKHVTKNISKATQAILALIEERVVEAQIDELKELNFQIAKNGWHKENAYKMYPYILDRLAQLSPLVKPKKG